MRIRKGDRVAYRLDAKGSIYVGMITGTRGWWLRNSCVDICGKGDSMNTIISRSDVVRIVQKREDIKEWWKYL